MARKNDMAFQVKNRVLVISEPQSTVNENMPLRDVIYYGRTIEKLIEAQNIYKSSLIKIPTPESILERCRPLYEYSWFVQKIREHQEVGMSLTEAITYAIEECNTEGIMTEFIKENGSEAVNVLFTEF